MRKTRASRRTLLVTFAALGIATGVLNPVGAEADDTTAGGGASASGLQLSAPDGKASCAGFGIPWHSGMPEGSSPCTISFNRSSAHLGGTTPLSIQVAYSATDGSSGTLVVRPLSRLLAFRA